MMIIGLTGGIGTGKTTVASIFAELGARVLDADRMAHRLMQPQGRCFRAIIKHFGKGILTHTQPKSLERKKLAALIFQNARKRLRLEKIIHPAVIKEIKEKVREYENKKRVKGVVLDVPLLFESGLDKYVDVIICVTASQGDQISRTRNRLDLTRKEVLSRLRAQWPMKEKMRLSDFIIDNRGSLKETRKQVRKIWKQCITP